MNDAKLTNTQNRENTETAEKRMRDGACGKDQTTMLSKGARKRASHFKEQRPTLRDAPEMIAYFREEIAEGRIPTFSGAAERLGYACGALMRACRERQAFRAAYAECRMLLVDYLIEGGLTKRLDGTLVKLMLAELGHAEVGGLGAYAPREPSGGSDGGVEIIVRVETMPSD